MWQLFTPGVVLKICFQALSQNCKKRLLASSCLLVFLSVRLSVCQHDTTRLPMDGFSWKLIFEYFFWSPWRRFKCFWNRTRGTGSLHDGQYTFMILSRSILLRFRNVADKSYSKIKTRFMFNNVFRKSSHLWGMREKKYSRVWHRWQHGAYALHAGYLSLQTHSQDLCNNGCTHALQSYVIRTLPALFYTRFWCLGRLHCVSRGLQLVGKEVSGVYRQDLRLWTVFLE